MPYCLINIGSAARISPISSTSFQAKPLPPQRTESRYVCQRIRRHGPTAILAKDGVQLLHFRFTPCGVRGPGDNASAEDNRFHIGPCGLDRYVDKRHFRYWHYFDITQLGCGGTIMPNLNSQLWNG